MVVTAERPASSLALLPLSQTRSQLPKPQPHEQFPDIIWKRPRSAQTSRCKGSASARRSQISVQLARRGIERQADDLAARIDGARQQQIERSVAHNQRIEVVQLTVGTNKSANVEGFVGGDTDHLSAIVDPDGSAEESSPSVPRSFMPVFLLHKKAWDVRSPAMSEPPTAWPRLLMPRAIFPKSPPRLPKSVAVPFSQNNACTGARYA